MPFVSVITINYNNAAGLEKTMRSVAEQEPCSFEFIVIDGNSNDGSKEVIKKFQKNIHYHISEKDNGIYDAQNKGLAQANGSYIIFMNSGDAFHNKTTLSSFEKEFSGSNKKIIYGDTNIIHANGSGEMLKPPAKLNNEFWYARTLNHQAVFTHASVFKELGNFSTHFRYASDFELMLKTYLKYPEEFLYYPNTICDFDNTGLTSSDSVHKAILEERKIILKANFSRKEYQRIRKIYLSSLPAKKRWEYVARDNKTIRTVLKPVYKTLKKLRPKK